MNSPIIDGIDNSLALQMEPDAVGDRLGEEWVFRAGQPDGEHIAAILSRRDDATAFLADYEAMLKRQAPQYATITASRANEASMREFFGGAMERAAFPNQQQLDFEGLRGRLQSSSYAPEPDDPGYAPIMAALRQVFDAHAREGRVVLPYQTLVYFGPLKPYQTGTRSAGAR